MNTFLSAFMFERSGVIGLAVDSIDSSAKPITLDDDVDIPSNRDVWFTPALHHLNGNGIFNAKKETVIGTSFLWVDVDDTRYPLPVLPPSIIIRSGRGWHLYYKLREPLRTVAQIEECNKLFYNDILTADKVTFNANRWMRVPGTVNTKYGQPIEVKLHHNNLNLVYSVEDIEILRGLDPQVMAIIRSGSDKGFKSRSERDWRVLNALVSCGATYETCELIFRNHKVGDKAQAEPAYFKHTWSAIHTKHAKKELSKTKKAPSPISYVERDDGLYNATKRISTFVFKPKMLLDVSDEKSEDALVGDVTADGYTWKDVTFERSAFNQIRSLDKSCPVAAWHWLGNENELRGLLPYLLDQLRAEGLPTVKARKMLGLHQYKEQWYFVGDNGTVGATDYWPNYTGPLHWLPNKREHPKLNLDVYAPSDEVKTLLTQALPRVNEPEVFWLMLGWYVAALLKPWLKEHGRRFPILNTTGTRGSGKSTLILNCFLPIFGQYSPDAYDAGTTKFVALSLLGSSNAVPISFSEFRFDSVQSFIRYILLSYDTGHDPRGKADQTTVDYQLAAPFSIDGEDLITDPAAQERIVVAQLRPSAIAEHTEGYRVWNVIKHVIPKNFGGWFIQSVLALANSEKLAALFKECEIEVYKYHT